MLWPLQQQVQDLMAQMVVMQERIKYLEGRYVLNSKNSRKPPSSDGLGKPAPKLLREAACFASHRAPPVQSIRDPACAPRSKRSQLSVNQRGEPFTDPLAQRSVLPLRVINDP